ncbi:hypothetical protein Tco_0098585 [Tanacetum coccineum]
MVLHPLSSMLFWRADNKLPVIIAKELDVEEKSALIKVLKSHKRALAWKLSDIQGINPEFCTHKILMEEDYAPAVQHQRRVVNPKSMMLLKRRLEKNFSKKVSQGLFTNPRNSNRQQQQVPPNFVEPFDLEEPINNQDPPDPPVVMIADNRTMAQLLEAPTEGYEDAIVVPEITEAGTFGA